MELYEEIVTEERGNELMDLVEGEVRRREED